MNRLTIHFVIENMSFHNFLSALPIFRSGIKHFLPPASVAINVSPENVIDGDIVITDLPITQVEATLRNITTYFHDMLPDVQTTFSYVDWEQRP